MATFARGRTAAALFFAALIGGFGASSALAQDYGGSTVTSSGGTTGVDIGDVLVLAPGVTINDGDVSNETGIGVVISGGTSAGASPGGGSNDSVDE
jgi:hypothetical protein